MNVELSFNPIVMINANNMIYNEPMKSHNEVNILVCLVHLMR